MSVAPFKFYLEVVDLGDGYALDQVIYCVLVLLGPDQVSWENNSLV